MLVFWSGLLYSGPVDLKRCQACGRPAPANEFRQFGGYEICPFCWSDVGESIDKIVDVAIEEAMTASLKESDE